MFVIEHFKMLDSIENVSIFIRNILCVLVGKYKTQNSATTQMFAFEMRSLDPYVSLTQSFPLFSICPSLESF